MKKKFLTAMFHTCVLLCNAQVITRTAGHALLPVTGWRGGIPAAREKTIPSPVAAARTTATDTLKQGASRFAWPIAADFSVLQEAGMRRMGNVNVYCIKITAPQAPAVSINFDQFRLQPGAVMYLYNAERTEVTGPVTGSENREDGFWGSDVYSGSSVYIELSIPADVPVTTVLHVDGILYGTGPSTRFGLSGACNVNVNCPPGFEWNVERNSVATCLTVDGGAFSGVLLNNACGNQAPYLLTAWHVAGSLSAQPLSKWRMVFQYWSPTCSPGEDGPQRMVFNGVRQLSSSSWSDFSLVELFQTPPENSGIVYAGWDRNGRTPQRGTCLHHPAGDVMKISKDTEPLPFTDWPGIGVPAYWCADWNLGVTERGSSGAPLFDENARVIGQLRGGYSGCASSNQRDYFGAFSVSWVGNGLSGNRLSDWLDPQGSGVMAVNSIPANHYRITGPVQFCNNAAFTISNLPANAIVNWQPPVPAGLASFSVAGNEARLQWIKDGDVKLTATVNLCGRILTLQSSIIRVGAWPQSLEVSRLTCNDIRFDVKGSMPAAQFEWGAGIGDLLLNGNAKKAVTTVPWITATGSYGTMAVGTTNSCSRVAALYADYLPYQREMKYGMAQPLVNGDHIVAAVDPVDGAYAYRWYLNDVLVQDASQPNYCTCNSNNDYNLITCGFNRLRVEAITDCGSFAVAADDRIEKACANMVTQPLVTVFPNPAADRLQVVLTQATAQQETGISRIVIYNKFGIARQQSNWSTPLSAVQIDIATLQPGVYFVEITDAQGHSQRKPLLVKR